MLAIYQMKYAVLVDKRTPFVDEACMICYGKSEKHFKELALFDISFGFKAVFSVAERNAKCLTCY